MLYLFLKHDVFVRFWYDFLEGGSSTVVLHLKLKDLQKAAEVKISWQFGDKLQQHILHYPQYSSIVEMHTMDFFQSVTDTYLLLMADTNKV